MIPSQLKTLIEKQPGDRIRTDRAAAERALAELGVSADSEFAQLYLAYKLLSFRSEVSYEELVDVAEPNRAVAVGTQFAHEVWGLPEKYVAFTSLEGEGAYLYDRETGQVWDFELASKDAFLARRQQPKFNSFFEFMEWYLGDSPGH